VKKGSKHINQKLNDSYPKPDVPADASWAMMNDMLDANMPVKKTWNWTKFLLSIFVGISIVSVATYYFWPKLTSDDTYIEKTNERNRNDEHQLGIDTKTEGTTSADALSAYQDTVPQLRENIWAMSKKPIATEQGTNSQAFHNHAQKTGSAASASSKASKTALATTNKKGILAYHSRTSKGNDDKVNESVKRVYPIPQSNSQQTDGQEILTKQASRKPEMTTRAKATIQNGILDIELLRHRPVNFKNLLSYPRISINPDSQNQKVINNKKTRASLSKTGIAFQWQSTIPLSGTKHFLKNGDSNYQGYRLLIPGISISQIFKEKNTVRFTFLPFGQYFTKEILLSNNLTEQEDSSTVITNRISLIKTSGWNAGVSYERAVLKNFEIAAGIFVHKQNYALLSSETTTANDSTSTSQSELINRKYASADLYINPYLFMASLEASYTFRKIQFGTGVFIPLKSMSPTITNVRPRNGKVFIRWKLK
jgi:hypothetical protein